MKLNYPSFTKTGGNTDLAFAVVVLASYFATFTSMPNVSNLGIILLIMAGIAYLTVGIYGYSICANLKVFWIRPVYFVIQIILGSLIIYIGGSGSFDALILLPLAGHSVMLLPAFWTYIANFGILVGYTLAVTIVNSNFTDLFSKLPIFLAGQIFIVVFTQMAVNEEKGREEVERLVTELGEVNQRLREYALQVEELAIAKERNRLAREIHDGIGHYLTTIHMQIQAARAILGRDPERTSETLAKAQALTQEALSDVRKSVASLRSSPDEDLPLTDSLQKTVRDFESSGIHTDYEILGTPRPLNSQAHLTIFRTVQESLNNIYKHSKASQVSIRLDYSNPSEVKLVVVDNGVGTDSFNGGFGLTGLKERVHLLEGSIIVESTIGAGFKLEVVIPG